jgi:hypothetical protein
LAVAALAAVMWAVVAVLEACYLALVQLLTQTQHI